MVAFFNRAAEWFERYMMAFIVVVLLITCAQTSYILGRMIGRDKVVDGNAAGIARLEVAFKKSPIERYGPQGVIPFDMAILDVKLDALEMQVKSLGERVDYVVKIMGENRAMIQKNAERMKAEAAAVKK